MACDQKKPLQVRSVNLGGWLVVEGWMKQSLFCGITNKDLLDGTQVQIKSVKTGKYLSAENGGGGNIVADKACADKAETFRLWRIDENTFNFRVANRKFVGLSKPCNTRVVAVENEPEKTEIFQIHRNPNYPKRVRIKASNGFFLQVKSDKLVTADYDDECKNDVDECGDHDDECKDDVAECGHDYDKWCYSNPSVFLLKVNTNLRGEYQLTNGYGPDRAPQVMQKHWNTYIVENDFKFIKENGLNTVRIPVGWWTAKDPEPPKPYIAGSLKFLDKAFDWAEKYGIKVIVDLHAAPGSQSGWEPSSTRDGEQEWGAPHPKYTKLSKATFCRDGFHEWACDDDHIQESVKVIEFFTKRYAKRPSLFGVQLLNEPRKPHVDLDVLIKYYRRGYEAVRNHSKNAYVVMSDRLGQYGVQDPSELLCLAKELPRSVIDVHYYNIFEPKFKKFTVQENINYIKRDRAREITKLRQNGALLFVGEWVAEWQVNNATNEDLKKFAAAQIQVYGSSTFGWGYWSLKNENDHWSLEWMIKNGYIKLT